MIRALEYDEIDRLEGFAPPGWGTNLLSFYRLHMGKGYFRGIIAEVDSQLVGCGNGLINGSVGWLGNIIVHPDYRRQGIGEQITRSLMDLLSQAGCQSQVLIASQMGEGVISARKYLFVSVQI